MAGNLFTDYFLTDGIKATPEWRTSVAVAAQFDAFGDSVRQRYDALTHSQDPNEAVTEQELIRPVLELLGWTDYLPQQGASRNEDIPDLLLFPDADAKERAITKASAEERYRDAVVVEESKRFGLPLDARGRDGRRQATTPHDQIVRYLSTAEVESEGRIRWGVLTNGGVWRLYDYRARPRCPASIIFAGWRQSVLPVHLLALDALLGCVRAVAGDVELQDDGVMDHPVNRRRRGHRVGEDALPLGSVPSRGVKARHPF